MFARGSRYRNSSESAPINARGERLVGKDLRFIPQTPGQFQHTVNEHDRLDLLAFKYYGDSERWWQIGDANPEFPFPLDLIDREPVVDELMALINSDNYTRFQDLVTAVSALGRVGAKSNSIVVADIVVVFPAATVRQQIISAIRGHGFQFLRSFSWAVAEGIAEAFTLEDRSLKTRWRAMLEMLRAIPGVIEMQSNFGDATIDVAYNTAMVGRDVILLKLSQAGFASSPQLSQQVERIGAKIVIPPGGVP